MNIKYLHKIKKNILEKKAKNTHKLLQIYNNNLITYLIEHNDKKNDPHFILKNENIYQTIFNINYPSISRDFKKIINHPLTSNEKSYHTLIQNNINKTTKIIVDKETKQMLKNLEYIKKTLEHSKIDINEYKKLNNKLSPNVSRKEILNRSLKEGKMYNGRELTYKELNNLSKNLEKYKKETIQNQLIKDINKESLKNGEGHYYTNKVWIWSGMDKTRHTNMDNQIVSVNEKFTVTNDNTGEIDYLNYPGDIENYTNPSNVINCQCSIEYIKKD